MDQLTARPSSGLRPGSLVSEPVRPEPTDCWFAWPRRRPVSLVGRPPASLGERLRKAAERAGRSATTTAPGDALTEFALLAPMLALVLFGITEIGRVVDASIVVQNAAREGARVAAVTYPDAATAGANAAAAYLTRALAIRGDIAAGQAQGTEVSSEVVSVTAEAQVELYTPITRALFANRVSLPVRATASMRRQ